MTKLLVVASTFPSHAEDTVPAFVRHQVLALKQADPSLEISILAPHDPRSQTVTYSSHEAYDEYRFRYAWPRSAQQLAGRGIMPTLQGNLWMFPLVFTLFACEFFALLRLTRRLRPDVIYAHWFTPQAVVARWVGAITRTEFVFTTHASDVSVWAKIPWLGPRIVRSNVVKARRFTAVSRRSMDKLRAFFDDAEWDRLGQRAEIIPMGVEHIDAAPPQGPAQHLLFIGRLVEKKGVQYLLEAVAAARVTNPDLRLTITGDGPMRAQLQARSSDLGLDDVVRFTGYLVGQAKADVMNTHGTYVVPSIVTDAGDAEGLPVSLMEGMAAAKVCIASIESGADDFIDDGRSGYLVPQRDVARLQEAIVRASSLSSADRLEMGDAARDAARQFHWPLLARRHIAFLLDTR